MKVYGPGKGKGQAVHELDPARKPRLGRASKGRRGWKGGVERKEERGKGKGNGPCYWFMARDFYNKLDCPQPFLGYETGDFVRVEY